MGPVTATLQQLVQVVVLQEPLPGSRPTRTPASVLWQHPISVHCAMAWSSAAWSVLALRVLSGQTSDL